MEVWKKLENPGGTGEGEGKKRKKMSYMGSMKMLDLRKVLSDMKSSVVMSCCVLIGVC